MNINKMRMLWVSNAPWVQTGYGVQTRMFAQRIDALGYKTAVMGYYGLAGGMLNWGGIPVYPMFYHPYGQDVMQAHADNFKADAILTLTDSWVIDTGAIRPGFPWIAWYPVDHIGVPPNVRRNIAQAAYRIAMTRFGQKVTNESGLHAYYVPHGVDTKVFKPQERDEARKKLGWPTDRYIVGTVAMNKGNPSRKSFVEMLTAFRNFKKVHPDAIYYLHTHMGTRGEAGGINLPELVSLLGMKVGEDVAFPDQYIYGLGFPDEYMANMYAALDVHMLVSKGEGFGIPLIEAQACGTPVITGAWTAMEELCFSGRLIAREDAELEWTGIAAFQMKPRISAIERALHAEYKDPSSRVTARRRAMEYDTDVVMEKYWVPVLAEINEKLMSAKEQFAKETALAMLPEVANAG